MASLDSSRINLPRKHLSRKQILFFYNRFNFLIDLERKLDLSRKTLNSNWFIWVDFTRLDLPGKQT
jgi:hypothetical protein